MIIDQGTDLSFKIKLIHTDGVELQPTDVTDLSVKLFTTDEDTFITVTTDQDGFVMVAGSDLRSLKSGVIAYSCSYTYNGYSYDNADQYTSFYLRDPDETNQPSDGGGGDGDDFVSDLYYTKEESDARYANREDVYTKSQINGKGYLTSESDPVFTASPAHRITNSDIDNWNSKTSNTGTVTGVKLNGTTNNPTNGIVDLGTVITDVSDKAEKSEMQVRTSGTQTTIQLKTGTSATVVRDTNYVHTDNNYTTAEKTKLSEITDGAEANVQADWSVTNTSSDAFIKNKPTIPKVDSSITGANQNNPVRGGAIYTALQSKAVYKEYQSYDAMILDDPDNGTIGYDGNEEKFYIYDSPNAEWRQIDQAGGTGGVQSNWNETDTSNLAYIQNKPTIPTKVSDLTNDRGFVADANYVHTDNNYTTTEKTKLAGLSNYDDTVLAGRVSANETALTNVYTKSQIDSKFTNVVTTDVSLFDGVDNYVVMSASYDDLNECNTLLITDNYSGNSLLLPLAGGFILKSGIEYKQIIASNSTITLNPSEINYLPSRSTAVGNYTIALQTVDSSIAAPTYNFHVANSIGKNKLTSLAFPSGTLWENGDVPDVNEFDNDASLEWMLTFTRISATRILASVKRYKS